MNKLSIIIPAFNEEKHIIEILRKVNDQIAKIDLDSEVIVVNDGSTDKTKKFLNEHKDLFAKYCENAVNSGKGAAIKKGIQQITGDIVIFQDSDFELDPREYDNLLIPFQKETQIDMVLGSRFINSSFLRSLNKLSFLANKVITLFVNILFWKKLTDVETGYKVFRAQKLKEINLISNRFDIEVELIIKALKKDFKFVEVPVSYNPRQKKDGKKIGAKDFFDAIIKIIYFKFSKL